MRLLGVIAIGGLSLATAPVAVASTNFTWTGKLGESVPKWSIGENWESNTAPAPSTTIGALSFPQPEPSVPCTLKLANGGCLYGSENNVSGLTVESMSIDDGEDYSIVGEPITLGSGGLSASPAAPTSRLTLSELDLPITLGTSQTWNISGEGLQHVLENGIYLGEDLTGSGSALTVDMSDTSTLYAGNDTEVGPVAIDGANTSEPGIVNGALELFDGDLNFSDGNPVSLNHIFLAGDGALGPLTTEASELAIGSGGYPADGIEAKGVKLDSASRLDFEIAGTGTVGRLDYSQLISNSTVELGNAKLEVTIRPPESGKSCTGLTAGQTYTFVSTAALSGEFSNAPEGAPEIPVKFAEACGKGLALQTMRIAYHESGGTETVTGTVEAEASEKRLREAKEEKEAEEQKAKKNEEASKKSAEENAKRTAEEAATREAAAASKRRLEEAATAAAIKKHQEEESAAQKLQEGAVANASVSLDGSTLNVQSNGATAVKLTCTGTGTCSGKLTLAAKGVAKKGKKAKTESIGTATFSVSAGKTTVVKLALNAIGRALLDTDHGRLSARLTILQLGPEPAQPQTKTVNLVLEHVTRKSKK